MDGEKITREQLDSLKTFTVWNHFQYFSEHFEYCLKWENKHWVLYRHCEVDGELTFIAIPETLEDLEYYLTQAGGVWED